MNCVCQEMCVNVDDYNVAHQVINIVDFYT